MVLPGRGGGAYQLITNEGVKCSWYSTHCYHQLHFGRVVSTGGVLSTVKLIVFQAVFFSFAFHLDRLLYTQRALMYIYLNDIQIHILADY